MNLPFILSMNQEVIFFALLLITNFLTNYCQHSEYSYVILIIYKSERTKIKDNEYPLVSRVLHGPCEKIAKLFIMEKDLGEEVPYDVSFAACIIQHLYTV